MGIKIYSNTKSIEAKRALRVVSALSSYIFENGYLLRETEKSTLEESIKVLNNIVKRV